jgi:predicted aconitase with swiveling domain
VVSGTVLALVDGEASGPVLALREPISFWGGVEVDSGKIVEQGHPEAGEVVGGTMLVMPHGRGSSSASSVLAEMIRLGTAPAALILGSADPIIVLGAVVAEEVYHRTTPVVVAEPSLLAAAAGSRRATLLPGGILELD